MHKWVSKSRCSAATLCPYLQGSIGHRQIKLWIRFQCFQDMCCLEMSGFNFLLAQHHTLGWLNPLLHQVWQITENTGITSKF